MNSLLRAALVLATCSAALSTLNFLQPDWTTQLIPTVQSTPDLYLIWSRADQVRHDLDKDLARVTEYIAKKRRITREVIAGRMTLATAAAQFAKLDQSRSTFPWEVFRATYRGDCDRERHCREVIAYAHAELCKTNPLQAAAVVEHLQEELEDGAELE